jgi:hypothetical protein
MTRAAVSVSMRGTPEQLAAQLWDLSALQRFWDPISQTDVLYDDGRHQEATMAVQRDGQLESIRIVRFRRADSIQFFNPEPPPTMTRHAGSWDFQPGRTADETLVVARRDYQLIRGQAESDREYVERCAFFNQRLEHRLGALLQRMRAFVDGATPAAYSDPELAPCTSST